VLETIILPILLVFAGCFVTSGGNAQSLQSRIITALELAGVVPRTVSTPKFGKVGFDRQAHNEVHCSATTFEGCRAMSFDKSGLQYPSPILTN
jgi:hypothetical protein